MKPHIIYKPTPAQLEFAKDTSTRNLLFSGGMGCGKTHAAVMKLLKLHHLNKPYNGGLVVPSLPEFKKDMLPEMEEIFYRNKIQYKFVREDRSFRFPFSRGKVFVVSAVTRIRGPNWAYAVMNEVTLMKLMRYKETNSRVRIKNAPFPQIAAVGTPEGIGSEYHDIFVDKPWPNSRVIYSSTADNAANLGEDYIQSMMTNFDAVTLQAYFYGQFVNMKGNRFYFNYDPVIHEDKTITPAEDGEWVHFSLDFNVSPMVGTAWVIRAGKCMAFDEIVLDNNGDTHKMADAMIVRGYCPGNTIIYPDPSGLARSTKGQPDVTILEQHGFQDIHVRRSHPTFRQRQLNVNNLLEKKVIKLHPQRCPTLRKDLLGVEQDKVTLEKIKTNPMLTHSSDGMDYLCDIVYPFSGSKPKFRQDKIR